ncbi:hypothetical protein BGW36DRAFT_431143 [Talaromyces proteolyticus]|uniref:F-box domain-containing protein n=1 Tax=Talaromyces proteolyticus TaxID=1131652 RepID=A0AAD4PSR2_9EURO|nr:uncharacterized protein BGW36DRAFT_431143 [Talaromyces proteolyticus]KAH8691901.1 hypothetical protein BGW36DRAFT_431143 [Talaromyces proteolyticus]
MLLGLPLELFYIILDDLSSKDLWRLYDTSVTLRSRVAQQLFCTTKISFESIFPRVLNGRRLSASRVFDILRERLPHIEQVKIYSYECSAQLNLFDLLSHIPHLKQCWIYGSTTMKIYPKDILERLFSPSVCDVYIRGTPFGNPAPSSTFTFLEELHLGDLDIGAVVLPKLEFLANLSIRFHPDRDVDIIMDFADLPRLVSLAIWNLDERSLTVSGISKSLERFEMHGSTVGWRFVPLLAKLGSQLQKIRIIESKLWCDLPADKPVIAILPNLSHLKVLELDDSINFLPLWLPGGVSLLEELVISIGEKDFEESWEDLHETLSALGNETNLIKCFVESDGCLLDLELVDWQKLEIYHRNYFILH